LIVAGLLAVVGELQLGWVIAVCAAGAFAGDNLVRHRPIHRPPAQQRFSTDVAPAPRSSGQAVNCRSAAGRS
jgi:hypothetical protein